MKISAVVLAGGRVEKSLSERFQVSSKGLIPLKGKMMILPVLEALRKSPSIEWISVSAPGGELPAEAEVLADVVASSGDDILDSLKNGIEALNEKPEWVLAAPCDAPFLTSEAVEDFLERCWKREADLCYSFVSREDSEKAYPELSHTYVRLREGVFCGGSLVLIRPEILEKALKLVREILSARKAPWRLAAILGFSIVWKFSQGALSIADLEERAFRLLGSRAAGIQVPNASVAFNVDSAAQLEQAEKFLE
ncbi:MAG: NTP transferase domain-containing protein [bacterium]